MDISSILNELGRDIIDDAKSLVPVDTGALRQSLDYEIDFKNIDTFNITFTGLEYGKYVNFGTRYQKAQPFMTTAINNNLDEGIDDITKQLTSDMISQIKIKLR